MRNGELNKDKKITWKPENIFWSKLIAKIFDTFLFILDFKSLCRLSLAYADCISLQRGLRPLKEVLNWHLTGSVGEA